MKKIAVGILIFSMILSGCTISNTNNDSFMEDWLKEAKLDAEETREELYQKALKEDTLVIYTESSRMGDVAKSFQKEYPGLTVSVNDIRAIDIAEMLRENYKNKTFDCDLVFRTNNDGVLSQEFIPQGLLYKYVPYDIKDKILPGHNEEMLMVMGEAEIIIYNDRVYGEQPIKNWWELTEEKWRGKLYMPNPTRSVSAIAFLLMVAKNDDLMGQAYLERYGKNFEPLNDNEGPGLAFIRMLMENGAVLVNSSDEAVESVVEPVVEEPPFGLTISSKTRFRDIGYDIMPAIDIAPFTGVYLPNGIMIAGGSKNINSAKLFIRWILGEADGTGEGYKPYLQSGAWSVRSDVEGFSVFEKDDMNLINVDPAYIYENKDEFLAFWESLLKNN